MRLFEKWVEKQKNPRNEKEQGTKRTHIDMAEKTLSSKLYTAYNLK